MPIPYARQNITKSDIDSVIDVLRSEYLTQGPNVKEFENQFAKYVGSEYAVAVSNGTAALHLSSLVLGVKNGQKIITTPITFAASANCIRYCGGDVVFADIDPDNYLIDYEYVSNLLKQSPPNTYSGLVLVDFAGYPIDLEKFSGLAKEYGLWIIEDACHAPGGYFIDTKGECQRCGNAKYADLGIFSFHPVKHIAMGEGGIITTNNKDIYDQLCLLRSHGITKDPTKMASCDGGWYYEMHQLGYNYRLSDIHAALGTSQLKRADENIVRRKQIAEKYDSAFRNSSQKIVTPKPTQGHAYHLYVIKVNDRKYVYDFLKKHEILCQVHYEPLHLMPYYKTYGWRVGDMPSSERYYDHCLSLPMYPSITDEEQLYVIRKVMEAIGE